jgi:GTP cyclohydrolase IA
MTEEELQELIRTQIKEIGDDPTREGLLDTPKRIIRSWQELYSGYWEKPADLLTVFDAESYDQIVLLKDIEMYSTCEHHMIPFYGKAHIAYIPDKKVIGISKLARLLEIYARRLQIQERIGEQVTEALMTYLKPKGAACIIEARHLCMCARGVGKQNSTMVTSSLKGAFFTSSAARMELMGLIK